MGPAAILEVLERVGLATVVQYQHALGKDLRKQACSLLLPTGQLQSWRIDAGTSTVGTHQSPLLLCFCSSEGPGTVILCLPSAEDEALRHILGR